MIVKMPEGTERVVPRGDKQNKMDSRYNDLSVLLVSYGRSLLFHADRTSDPRFAEYIFVQAIHKVLPSFFYPNIE